MPSISLKWISCKDYGAAKDHIQCLYVFTRGSTVIYVGKAKRFGGSSGRYAYGYRYLIECLLESKHSLWIAPLEDTQWKRINDYEQSLISLLNPRVRQRILNHETLSFRSNFPWNKKKGNRK